MSIADKKVCYKHNYTGLIMELTTMPIPLPFSDVDEQLKQFQPL
jgi:hypothetical protein